jgi:hypothetical protein
VGISARWLGVVELTVALHYLFDTQNRLEGDLRIVELPRS